MEIYPHDLAAQFLAALGVDYDAVYNDRDGITRQQLTIISAMSANIGTYTDPNDGKKKTLKENAYTTIHRLYDSANRKNLNFEANLKNTLEGTVSTALMSTINENTTKKQKQTLVRWLPSTAKEEDPFHALNYGKIMPYEDAQAKGLGTRYGCQCGFEIIDEEKADEFDQIIINAVEK